MIKSMHSKENTLTWYEIAEGYGVVIDDVDRADTAAAKGLRTGGTHAAQTEYGDPL